MYHIYLANLCHIKQDIKIELNEQLYHAREMSHANDISYREMEVVMKTDS